MSLIVKEKSRTSERSENGYVRKQALQGTLAECQAYQAAHAPGEYLADFGRLASSTISQIGGPIWQIELRYTVESGSGTAAGATPPDTSFGVFSATLDASMISNPLEAHPNYRTNWNYFLAARDWVPGTALPSFWSTATSPVLTGTSAQNYRWMKDASELPIGPDAEGHIWTLIMKRTKAADQYDVAMYTQTETAKFATFPLACAAIAAKINKIASSPGVANGLTGGNWKCDRATVRYSRAWLASLTWTMSYDTSGWDTDFYDAIT